MRRKNSRPASMQVLYVSASGTSPEGGAWPAADSVTTMVLLAHVRSAFTLRTGPTAARAWCTHFRRWAYHRAQARRPADAPEWLRARQSGVQHSPQLSRLSDRPDPLDRGLRSGGAEREVLPLLSYVWDDREGWPQPRRRHRPVCSARRRLATSDRLDKELALSALRGPSPCGVRSPASFTREPRQPILLPRLPG